MFMQIIKDELLETVLENCLCFHNPVCFTKYYLLLQDLQLLHKADCQDQFLLFHHYGIILGLLEDPSKAWDFLKDD